MTQHLFIGGPADGEMVRVTPGARHWRMVPRVETVFRYDALPTAAMLPPPVEYTAVRMMEGREEIVVFCVNAERPITQLMDGYRKLKARNERLEEQVERLKDELAMARVASVVRSVPSKS